MTRYAARVDANQAEIVDALRDAGASVQHLHRVGAGCPDLLIGFRNTNLLFEVKDGNKVPSKQALRRGQEEWHKAWRGQVAKVTSAEEALAVMFSVPQSVPLVGVVTGDGRITRT